MAAFCGSLSLTLIMEGDHVNDGESLAALGSTPINGVYASIKREIGHMCRDERQKPKAPSQPPQVELQHENPNTDIISPELSTAHTPSASTFILGVDCTANDIMCSFFPVCSTANDASTLDVSATQPDALPTWNPWERIFRIEVLRFCPLNKARSDVTHHSEFLETLDERSFFNPNAQAFVSSAAPGNLNLTNLGNALPASDPSSSTQQLEQQIQPESLATQTSSRPHTEHLEPVEVLPSATKAERFLLTAADQEAGTRDERLARVIHAKFEAGLLRPFNYVKGYARLSRWMERKYIAIPRCIPQVVDSYLSVSPESRQQILQPLSVLRPKFRVSPHSSYL
jgi:hypothetical protein